MTDIFDQFDALCKPHKAAAMTPAAIIAEISGRIDGQHILASKSSGAFNPVRLAALVQLRAELERMAEIVRAA